MFSSNQQKPQPADGGIYKCNIKNEFGELNANLNLNIEGELEICVQLSYQFLS